MSAPDSPPDNDRGPVGPVDFSTHVVSLASSAMVALGRLPAPGLDAVEIDREAARHLIDVLDMLATKTRGNLDEAEHKLLHSLIYDLRVAYVDVSNAAGAVAAGVAPGPRPGGA